jgi:sulfatase maturation enzyme AslB (radical SAM superfamily)
MHSFDLFGGITNTLPKRCREGRYLLACNSECPKNRLIRAPDGELGLNYLCGGLLRFWHHIDRDVQDLCRHIARGEPLKGVNPHRNCRAPSANFGANSGERMRG